MWMKISLLLAALLVWDAATSDNGQSALQRSGDTLMSIGPVHDFVDYVKDGGLVDDVTALTSKAAATTATMVAGASAAVAATDTLAEATTTLDKTSEALEKASDALEANEALEKERVARREARAKRQADFHLSADDVNKIAEAVADLYRKEKTEAAETASNTAVAPLDPAPAPSPETVERSVASLAPDLLSAIIKASKETGANSGYLLHIALRESGLVLAAAAPTSTATGPFQFIASTWYQMLGTYGPKHGLDAEAALLTKRSNGSYTPISDEAAKELLSLRTDPYVSALMAGELTMENSATLTRLLGRAPAHGELYAAHVFGAGGAAKLVETRDKAAATSAATILPSAASANRWLFYTAAGKPRTVAALFDELSRFMSTTEVATVCNANLNFFN